MTQTKNISPQIQPVFKWLILILILFGEFLGQAWVRTESTQTILRISRAQAVIAEKRSYQRALSLERDRLKSDARITDVARNKLGLSTHALSQTIYLSGDVQ